MAALTMWINGNLVWYKRQLNLTSPSTFAGDAVACYLYIHFNLTAGK